MTCAVSPTALAEVLITSIEYPWPPETLAVGEIFPVIVTISYYDLAESMLRLQILPTDAPPWLSHGDRATLSGSGFYQFPPIYLRVPYSNESTLVPTGGWTGFISQWRLTAQVVFDEEIETSRDFIMWIENPEKKPKVKISEIEYVEPPDTIAVHEPSQVKINAVYSNLDPSTRVTSTIRDQSKLLDSMASPPLSGSGECTFVMSITPTRAGLWNLVADLHGVSGSFEVKVADKEPFQIRVVPS